MQYTTTLSVAFFAALATATHHPAHLHHRREVNATAPLTTLTVLATKTHTVLSCAASVTDCPLKSQTPVVVTEVLTVATTICPVAEAESASSAALSSFSAGPTSVPAGVITASVPFGTGVPSSGASATGEVSGDTTLTYTLGSGTSTTVVTTTIKHSSTNTVFATLPASSAAGGLADVTGAEAVVESSATTTLTGTSTSTKYVTVVAASSGVAGGDSGASCAPVTVTVALSTVTVTAGATPASAADGSAATTLPLKGANVSGAAGPSGSDVVILSTATVLPVPVATLAPSGAAPYGNGTVTTSTKSKCASTFVSKKVKATTTPLAARMFYN